MNGPAKPNSKKRNISSRSRKVPGRDRISDTRNVQYPSTAPKIYQNVQANYKIVTLDYELSTEVFANPGSFVVSDFYKINSPYDFLLSLFTQAIQYLGYNFGIYGRAVVQKLFFNLIFSNLEQVPIDLFFYEAPFNLVTSFASRSQAEAMAGTAACVWRDVMSEQYGKKSQVQMKRITVPSSVLGNKQVYHGDEDYTFTVSNDPAKLLYGGWVAVSPQNTIATGIAVRLSVQLKIKFYAKLNITSPLYTRPNDIEYYKSIKHLTRAHSKKNLTKIKVDSE
jgi:hypothetical protein